MSPRRRTKKVGPTRGLGARYGSTVRKKYIKVLSQMKKKHRCPKCASESVRRKSVGIWNCRKCGSTFSGGAYLPSTELGIVAERSAKGQTPPETAAALSPSKNS
ncbi:MAG: 50S ribosomal protein L37ae [Candidatus Bathyarchaeota archaeon]|nr:MAG: 50S ribosomal protein L37ae [Candidatus Bathyarchaeota archaeon]